MWQGSQPRNPTFSACAARRGFPGLFIRVFGACIRGVRSVSSEDGAGYQADQGRFRIVAFYRLPPEQSHFIFPAADRSKKK
jgi:hypothetical protein